MKIGDLVKYRLECDATGWIGVVVKVQSNCVVVLWTDKSGSERMVSMEVLEVMA